MTEETLDCICKGNWRLICHESSGFIGRSYKDNKGKVYTFFGLVNGVDDYYYGMNANGEMKLLSCVGSIKTHGYELIDHIVDDGNMV